MNNLAIKEVDFNGDILMAAQDKNTEKIYVGVSWVCNGLGLNKSQKDTQVQKIQNDLVLKQGCLKFQAGIFDEYNESLALELEFLPLWLAKISITPKMKEEQPFIVAKLVEYQLKAKDTLANEFIHKSQFSNELSFLQGILDKMKADELRVSYLERQSKQHQILIEQTNNNVIEMKDQLTKSPDFKNLQNAVNKYARKVDIHESEAWGIVYKKVGDIYGVNLEQIVRNRHRKMNKERVQNGKKPYAQSTLDSKFNKRKALAEKGLMKEAMEILAGL